MFLRAKPFTGRGRQRGGKMDYERHALAQGLVAVNSILRDWVKGQLTAVECGMLPFEAVFMPHVIMADGRSLIEHVTAAKMLPAPKG
jgi:hypothetical protein